jgi:2',3'-cyclic-nucleotide 2'-phosphodiesterase (5'-nucleotidase family)
VRLLFFFIALFSLAPRAEDAPAGVTFILAADMPNISDERSGYYPQLRTLVTEHRQQSDPTFFVFGGGSIGPSALSSFDRGSHIIDILNSIEPDVMGVTKREFSFYEDELSLRSYEAAFPFVTSNVIGSRQGRVPDGIHTSVIIEQSGITLGVISVLHERVISEYQLSEIAIEPPQKAIIEKSKSLRQRGADIVLLHYSYPFKFIDTLLQKGVVDIAFISDSRVSEKQLGDETLSARNVKLAGVGSAVVVSVERDEDNHWTVTSKRDVNLGALSPDSLVSEQVYGYEARLKRLLNIQIGEWRTAHSTNRTEVRTGENAFVNFVVDTVRRYTGTDIVIVNGGSIRGNKRYEVGMPITRQDIVTEMPFRASVTTLKLTGEQLILALEQGLSQIENIKGGFPHVSGMAYTFDSNARPFTRVKSVMIAGEPLRNDKTYTLATSDFLANGGDGYLALKDAPRLNSESARPPQIADLVVQRIANNYDIVLSKSQRIVDTAKGH